MDAQFSDDFEHNLGLEIDVIMEMEPHRCQELIDILTHQLGRLIADHIVASRRTDSSMGGLASLVKEPN